MSTRIQQLEPKGLDDELAQQVVQLYATNYPAAHSETQRLTDLEKRDTPYKLKALLENSIVLLAQDVRGRIQGVLEYKFEELPDGIYAILAWMLVNPEFQGQGISSALHRVFEAHATTVKERLEKPTAQLLSVHKDNPARAIYEKWGYTVDERGHPTPDMIFMYKDVETSGEKAVRLVNEWQPTTPERVESQFNQMLMVEGYTALRGIGEMIRGIYDLSSAAVAKAEERLYPLLRDHWNTLREAYFKKAEQLGLKVEVALPQLPEAEPIEALRIIQETVGRVNGVNLGGLIELAREK